MVPELFIQFRPEDQKDRKGYFIILSGPSGVGKNTLLNRILKDIPGIYYVPSATTRPMRPGESQMNPYVFLSTEEFLDLIKKGHFLEWKKIHTNAYYGTHLPTIRFAIDNGFDIITDMDVLGCADAAEAFPERIRTIFITPPSLAELSHRLHERDSDSANIEQRLSRVELELRYQDQYDYLIVNDDLEVSTLELKQVIQTIIQEPSASLDDFSHTSP